LIQKKYLGLEAMSHLASLSTETSNMVKKYQETVISMYPVILTNTKFRSTVSLKDADISIRRRALDLLYGMCDKYTSKEIVGELLTYLLTADYAIREELVFPPSFVFSQY
jgi:AP-2 complex subunit alpha